MRRRLARVVHLSKLYEVATTTLASGWRHCTLGFTEATVNQKTTCLQNAKPMKT